MPRQQQLCLLAGADVTHHAIIQAALVPSQGRHSTNTVNIPTMVTMVTIYIVSTVSCPARD